MPTTKTDALPGGSPEIVLTRVYDAPKALVWEAITTPRHLMEWFGPNGFTNKDAVIDLRVGGEYSTVMQGPGGFARRAVYSITEVAPIERLAIESTGGRDPSADDYFHVRMTFQLSEVGGKTELVLTGDVLAAGPRAKGPFTGGEGPWSQSLGRLGDHLQQIQN